MTRTRFSRFSGLSLGRCRWRRSLPQLFDSVTPEVELTVDFFCQRGTDRQEIVIDMSGCVSGGSANSVRKGIPYLPLLVGRWDRFEGLRMSKKLECVADVRTIFAGIDHDLLQLPRI